ncbi:MAG TPA: hypothetical protein VGI39_43305 [Polyangiaceae bacterium]|jgi:hypothetical protein
MTPQTASACAAACAVVLLVLPLRAGAEGTGERVLWHEGFERTPLDLVDPFHHDAALVARVYSVEPEGGDGFLHALHDDTAAHTPAVHLGKVFGPDGPPLDRVAALRWRWRVLRHPSIKGDPWEDVAASLYVVVSAPTMLRAGRGFKLGWLAAPGRDDTRQHGLLQVPLLSAPSGPEWRSARVDLCALYRRSYGRCEGEHVEYVGVTTDADGTRSIASADYDDLELLGTP